jgi:anaerobic C4-dicarboxylate transporter
VICPVIFFTILQKVAEEEKISPTTLADVATQGMAIGSSPLAAAAVISNNGYSLMHTAIEQLPHLSNK